MPFVRVTIFPQTKKAREGLAKWITEAAHKVTNIPQENIWVVHEEEIFADDFAGMEMTR